MNQHDRKYYEFITITVNKLIRDHSTTEKFNKRYSSLIAVIPKYGLSLDEFNKLLDKLIDPESQFKNSEKNKLISLLYCRELLDFKTVLKIISVFKAPSYYNNKKILRENIQIKLSTFLLKNFTNIRWDKNFLKILNPLFNLLSIGYLRLNIGLFLVYLLNITYEIDPSYNKRYFYTVKKFNTLLELYESDKKNTLFLLLNFTAYLSSIHINDVYDLLYSKYLAILSDVKISKDLYGKIDIPQLEHLAQMKKLMETPSSEMSIFKNNVKMFIQVITNLNTTSSSNFMNTLGRKRKYLEDDNLSSLLMTISIHKDYTSRSFVNTICKNDIDQNNHGVVPMLKYLSTLNLENLNNIKQKLDFLLDDIDFSFVLYTPIISILLNVNLDVLDDSITTLLQVKEDNIINLTTDLHWIFQSLGVFYIIFPNASLLPCIENIFSNKTKVTFNGNENEKLHILNFEQLIQYLEPDFEKYELVLTRIIDNILKTNDRKLMKGIVLLAARWVNVAPKSYIRLLKSVLNCFSYSNLTLIDELLVLLTQIQTLTYSEIDIMVLVLQSDLMAMIFFTGDIFKINALLQHVLYCKRYFAEFGLTKIENITSAKIYKQNKAVKELHNSYVMDICNFLWRNRQYEINDISSGRFFGFPNAFIEKLDHRSMDLVHLPSTRCVHEFTHYKGLNGDMDEEKTQILKTLQEESYSGIVGFLQHSIRGLST